MPFGKEKVERKTFYLNVWNELFLSLGKHVKNDKLLNQNRFVALLGYRLDTEVPIKIEGGVTLQTIMQYNMDVNPTNPSVTYNKANVETNTAFTIYVIVDEFHKLFQKKAEEAR